MKVKLEKWAYKPEKAHEWDAGFDIRTPKEFTITGMADYTIDTGIHCEIPEGFCGQIISKSGLNVNNSIVSTGLIDAGYTGSIKVKLYNLSIRPFHFDVGDKITQLVIMPIVTDSDVEVVGEIKGSERGDAGFGSTGK